MDIEQPPPWSGKQLKRLGQSLVAPGSSFGKHPAYEDVMAWHADLSDEISSRIANQQWSSGIGDFDVSSRAKTVDTLREKLIRESHLNLNQVQDIAGVRVDIDGHLGDQTAFCEELCEYFGGDTRAVIKEIRDQPHSGYRAVHVWLRLPAGRVEIQVRTRHQSAWANVYERLGDLLGREIRYGGTGEGAAQQIVESMHGLSDGLRSFEEGYLASLEKQERLAAREHSDGSLPAGRARAEQRFELKRDVARERQALVELHAALEESLETFLDGMQMLERRLDALEQSEVGE